MKKFNFKKWLIKNIFPVTAIGSVFAVTFLGVLVWYQIANFEDGMLDVCATQQDAYVQLVLDQINIKSNRDNEEIITEILGSLDASSNKYWTFSKNEAMVFVKDVLETNKYQGFTTATYYVSESAKAFLAELKLNKVTHKTITIGDKEFISSGVVFEYGGDEYRLCLLSNKNIFLDNNKFLGSKVNLCVLFALVSFIFIVTAMQLAHQVETMLKKDDNRQDMIESLNASVNQLNEKLSEKELYDTRNNILGESMLPEFLDKFQKRKVEQLVFAQISCEDERAKEEFFAKAQIVLNQSVLRFKVSEHSFLLLFVRIDPQRVLSVLKQLEMDGVRFDNIKAYYGEGDILNFYDDFKKR